MSRDLTALGQRDKWHWDGMGRYTVWAWLWAWDKEQVGNICDVERLSSTDVERLSFTPAYSVCSHVERLLGIGMGGLVSRGFSAGGWMMGWGIYMMEKGVVRINP